ncbi:MAG TPA: glycoside hydrolase family 28 protein [Bacteroidales bacterium]
MNRFRNLFLICLLTHAGVSIHASQIKQALPDETATIQRAIDSCANAGGGTVTIKPGVHMIKPIYLKSKITLYLTEGATLMATDNPDDFMVDGRYVALINGKSLTDVTIAGKGIIDGNGAGWWKRFLDSNRKIPRPRMIVLNNVKNLTMEDVTLKNSPTFLFVPTDCENVTIKNVYVTAPDSAPNTDGIDPSRCKNITITNCKFDVGDDCIAVKSNKTEKGTGFECENLEIRDCIFYHGHGLSIGSETSGGVNNMRVDNCKFYGTENGIRIKSSNERGGKIENISYSNITMENVGKPILFDFTYVDKNSIYRDGPKAAAINIPSLSGITIKNLVATGASKAGIMLGTPESILKDIILENVTISAKTGMQIENAKGLKFENVKVNVQKGEVYILKNAEGTGLN